MTAPSWRSAEKSTSAGGPAAAGSAADHARARREAPARRVRCLVHGLRRPAGAPDDPAARRAARRVHAADRGFAGGPPDHRTNRCTRGLGRGADRHGPFGLVVFTERTGCGAQAEVSTWPSGPA